MQLNLTAMIDVVFLLLVYFIITVNFAADEGVLTGAIPQRTGESRAQDLPRRPIQLLLSAHGPTGCMVRVTGQPHVTDDFDQVAALLIENQWQPDLGRRGLYRPDHPVLVAPDAAVRWQHVVNAFNAAARAGFANVSFAPPAPAGQNSAPAPPDITLP
jgi:biopolymer transport protein ExbD